MTEFDVQKRLFEEFRKLNDFSGAEFITETNVAYPNKDFDKPEDNRYFILSMANEEPYPVSEGYEPQLEVDGFFQIDIVTPIGAGEEEPQSKFEWLSKLFRMGKDLDIDGTEGKKGFIDIKGCSRTQMGAGEGQYRTVMRITFTAFIEL